MLGCRHSASNQSRVHPKGTQLAQAQAGHEELGSRLDISPCSQVILSLTYMGLCLKREHTLRGGFKLYNGIAVTAVVELALQLAVRSTVMLDGLVQQTCQHVNWESSE